MEPKDLKEQQPFLAQQEPFGSDQELGEGDIRFGREALLQVSQQDFVVIIVVQLVQGLAEPVADGG